MKFLTGEGQEVRLHRMRGASISPSQKLNSIQKNYVTHRRQIKNLCGLKLKGM